MGGQGRGVLSEFKLTRVSGHRTMICILRIGRDMRRGGENYLVFLVENDADICDGQFNFRVEAMAGNLPGVKRASW